MCLNEVITWKMYRLKVTIKTELVTIGGENDVLYYISKYMGTDFAECAKRNLQMDYEELKDDYKFLKTEFDLYEKSLDNMSGLMHDSVYTLDEVIEDIRTSKRLSKKKLLEKLENLRREIYNEL